MKKLYRVRQGRVLSGVCTGLGEYFDADPVLFRVVWILLALFTAFFGALIGYLVVTAIVPSKETIGFGQ